MTKRKFKKIHESEAFCRNNYRLPETAARLLRLTNTLHFESPQEGDDSRDFNLTRPPGNFSVSAPIRRRQL